MVVKDSSLSIFNRTHDWKITIVGLGGTGSRLAEKIAELNYMLLNSNKPGIQLNLIDFDIVEEKNIGRQKFYPNQIDQFKTKAIAQNLSRNYLMKNIKTCELKIEDIKPSMNKENIIISCVDNFDARMFIHLNYKNSYIIDLGNEKDFGQIFLSKYKELQNPIDFFGLENFQKQSEESNFSCENYEDQFEQQSHFINEAMALYGIELLKDFLLNDTINYNCIFVNLKEKITKKALKLCQ